MADRWSPSGRPHAGRLRIRSAYRPGRTGISSEFRHARVRGDLTPIPSGRRGPSPDSVVFGDPLRLRGSDESQGTRGEKMRSGPPGLRLGRERCPDRFPCSPDLPGRRGSVFQTPARSARHLVDCRRDIMDGSACRATLPGRAGRSRHVPKKRGKGSVRVEWGEGLFADLAQPVDDPLVDRADGAAVILGEVVELRVPPDPAVGLAALLVIDLVAEPAEVLGRDPLLEAPAPDPALALDAAVGADVVLGEVLELGTRSRSCAGPGPQRDGGQRAHDRRLHERPQHHRRHGRGHGGRTGEAIPRGADAERLEELRVALDLRRQPGADLHANRQEVTASGATSRARAASALAEVRGPTGDNGPCGVLYVPGRSPA